MDSKTNEKVEHEQIKYLNCLLNAKKCPTKEGVEKVFSQYNSPTTSVKVIYEAILSRIEFEDAKIKFNQKSEQARQTLIVTTRKRQIANISVDITKDITSGIKFITITNLDNNYTVKGRARSSSSDLTLFKDIYRNSKQVKRDITLFFQLGDEINVYEAYTRGLIFKLTKINSKTVVFSCGGKNITVDRYTPTFRNTKDRQLCCRINVNKTNCSKVNRDINPVRGDFHRKKYKSSGEQL